MQRGLFGEIPIEKPKPVKPKKVEPVWAPDPPKGFQREPTYEEFFESLSEREREILLRAQGNV